MKNTDKSGEAIIEGNSIVIRAPISVLPIAFDFCPLNPYEPTEALDKMFVVDDVAAFATYRTPRHPRRPSPRHHIPCRPMTHNP